MHFLSLRSTEICHVQGHEQRQQKLFAFGFLRFTPFTAVLSGILKPTAIPDRDLKGATAELPRPKKGGSYDHQNIQLAISGRFRGIHFLRLVHVS